MSSVVTFSVRLLSHRKQAGCFDMSLTESFLLFTLALYCHARSRRASQGRAGRDRPALFSRDERREGLSRRCAVDPPPRVGRDQILRARGSTAHGAGRVPQRFSAVLGPKNRVGKIFIDYLRNSRGASTVAAFSVRARSGMGVSMPVSWDELKEVSPGDEWTMQKAIQRQRSLKVDLWQGHWQIRHGITAAMRRAVAMDAGSR
ncbi:non-homologous end-joining DNA ligase LigD [Paraburkholderia strydomiana]